MGHNEDRNLLKIRILESAPPTLDPCGGGHASEIQLVANQYVSESRVRLLRPISRSLPLAQDGSLAQDRGTLVLHVRYHACWPGIMAYWWSGSSANHTRFVEGTRGCAPWGNG